MVFDAMFVGGKDIRKKPLLEREDILKALLPRDPLLRYSDHVAEFGKREFAKAKRAHRRRRNSHVSGILLLGQTNA